jgi:hypothetical protein
MASNKPEKTPTIRQSKSALLEAAQAAIADQRVKGPGGPLPGRGHPGGRARFRGTLLVVMLIGAGILIARPVWLVGPSLPAESEAVAAASATLALVEAVSHVKAFAAATGRLPSRLTEAGVVNPAITLRLLDGGDFEVALTEGNRALRLRSSDSLKALVIDAIRTLQRRT